MKAFAINAILFVLLAGLCSGCVTGYTLHRAKGLDFEAHSPHSSVFKGPYPEPGYLALLPVVVPLDIATSPLQGLMLLMWQHSPTIFYQ